MTDDFALERFYGALDSDTADELERVLVARRAARSATHRDRVAEISDALD